MDTYEAKELGKRIESVTTTNTNKHKYGRIVY